MENTAEGAAREIDLVGLCAPAKIVERGLYDSGLALAGDPVFAPIYVPSRVQVLQRPQIKRSKSSMQVFFVNGGFMRAG